ncbi:methyltransferase domain protein [Necator americanus]|uniref:phosphoethanolamine N-methyltransferase n=1 Tax=Necator americanus TaxID=51031 RepID=W2TML1_NECAM|nr:methyltransferase domain protein [Necator americanus]ETN82894.1 methyltransferase domain protein [Necator americanus]
MPAVEQQLVECVHRVLRIPEPWRVGVVSGENVNNLELEGQFGESTTVNSIKGTNSIETFVDLDVLVVNQALDKELQDSSALDKFVSNALQSLRLGGACVIRQDLTALNDPKKVAKLTDYLDVFRIDEGGEKFGFSFYAVNEVEDSIYAHQNWQDYIWTLTKKQFPTTQSSNITFRDFLDKTQYTDTGIDAYEWIFGKDFISPGGWDQNLSILKRFGSMKTGQKMLDIGVGIGGGARQAASEFGLHVCGVDLSSNMLAVALQRIQRDKDSRVTYAICDATAYDFEPASFDYVFSRDCIQHIENTENLFSRIYRALKPGGKVLITMYGVGYGELSENFKRYVKQRQYYLKNTKQIREIAEKVGFTDIVVENMTGRFEEILEEERQRVENNKEEFLSKFSQNEYDSLVNGWNAKLQFIADDNHNWNLFLAVKPQ